MVFWTIILGLFFGAWIAKVILQWWAVIIVFRVSKRLDPRLTRLAVGLPLAGTSTAAGRKH